MSELLIDTPQWQHQRGPRSYSNNKNKILTLPHVLAYNGSDSSSTATRLTNHDTKNKQQNYVGDNDVDGDDGDTFSNVLSLQLRKPKRWKWELTTSRSCSNIALPRILLYDHTGELLVDADSQQEQTYRPRQSPTQLSRAAAATPTTPLSSRKRASKSATSNLAQSIRQALDRQFSALQIQEATPSPTRTSTAATMPTTEQCSATIEFCSNELPEYKFQRRAHSLKGVRFKETVDADGDTIISDKYDNKAQSLFNIASLPTPPSTITTSTNTPTNSSSSGPREKRRYRRSHSSGRSPAHSASILERFSFNKGRFSSPEYAVEHDVIHAPRYVLRTSKAGTLIVQDESFSRCRRRRKVRNSSTDNMQKSGESGSKSSLRLSDQNPTLGKHLSVHGNAGVHLGAAHQCGSSAETVAASQQPKRHKVYPVRRYRSDGNVLLQRQASVSTDEEFELQQQRKVAPRRYSGCRKQSKKELSNIASKNTLPSACGARTAR